uniref:PRKR interacting protein 1 n=2 Tax=Erpetoichthys calabaricus TaxID=27687 RepID=A0A8C4SSR0_ERPCA
MTSGASQQKNSMLKERMSESGNVESQTEKPKGKNAQPLIIAKTPAEEQRLKLERLMRNPDKPVPVPERPKEWNPRAPPEFVRDVMGSSAGAGSGEFHVYRHLRRREYQRQEFMDAMSEKNKKDDEFQKKLQENHQKAEERTAKRRKKRQKLKEKKHLAKKPKQEDPQGEESNLDLDKVSRSEDEESRGDDEDDGEEPSFIMGRR